MVRKTNLLAAVAMTVGLTSCFQSKVPLSDPDPGVTDENLKGVWHAVIEKNDVYLHIIPLTPPLMKLIRVTHINAGGFYNMDEIEMFPTFVEGKKFMNLKFLMPKEAETGQGELEPRFTFVKYVVSKEGVLTAWGLDYDGWNKAITGKRVKGAAGETTWGSTVELKLVFDSLETRIAGGEGLTKARTSVGTTFGLLAKEGAQCVSRSAGGTATCAPRSAWEAWPSSSLRST